MALLRERAAALTEGARRDRGLALEATGEYERAADLLREASQRDGGDEAVLAALMRAESWVRSPAAALEIYEHYRRRLRELGAVPGPATRAAHEAVLITLPPNRCTGPLVEQFKDVLTKHPGGSTVRLTLTSPGREVRTQLDASLRVEASPAFYSDIKALLGPGCLRH